MGEERKNWRYTIMKKRLFVALLTAGLLLTPCTVGAAGSWWERAQKAEEEGREYFLRADTDAITVAVGEKVHIAVMSNAKITATTLSSDGTASIYWTPSVYEGSGVTYSIMGVSEGTSTIRIRANDSKYMIPAFTVTVTPASNAEEAEENIRIFAEIAESMREELAERAKAPQSDIAYSAGVSKKITEYGGGQYLVGVDIPSGEYMLWATDDKYDGYFCYSTDANGKDIIKNGTFGTNSIIDVRYGEYLTLTRCYAVALADAETPEKVGGAYGEGFYIIGEHIPAGTYKLVATDSTYSGYYCIYNDLRREDIDSNAIFDNSRYVELSDGQYLHLQRCKIIVD